MKSRKFDIVIGGAGIIGCAVAYFLAKKAKGSKIAVVERAQAGAEASGGAAGMLAAQIETHAPGPFLDLALLSRGLYETFRQELESEAGTAIQWSKRGILSLAATPAKAAELKSALAWQKDKGLACQWWSREETREHFPFLEGRFEGALFCPEDGQVASSRVVSAFESAARKMGVAFIENCELSDYDAAGGVVRAFLARNGERIEAEKFVVALGPWTGRFLRGLVSVEPVRGQILIFEIPKSWKYSEDWQTSIYAGTASRSGEWGSYFVPKGDGHLLVGATSEKAGFDKSENRRAGGEMIDYVKEIFPDIQNFPFKGTWVGLRPGTPDALPHLGLVPGFENFYVAAGHFRNGILLAPATGKLMAELILDGKSSFPLEPFSPLRFVLDAADPPA